jgi:hypothetical protein
MKTSNFELFAKDKIQQKELNFLKGGIGASDDPVHDLLNPPRRCM